MARPAVLSPQQAAFARAFVAHDGNAAAAARTAGYAQDRFAGRRLLLKDHVLTAVVAAARAAGADGEAALIRLQQITRAPDLRLRADLLVASPELDAGRHARAERDAILRTAKLAGLGAVGPGFRSLACRTSAATAKKSATSIPSGSGSPNRSTTEKGKSHGQAR